jgi:hypothetical protein
MQCCPASSEGVCPLPVTVSSEEGSPEGVHSNPSVAACSALLQAYCCDSPNLLTASCLLFWDCLCLNGSLASVGWLHVWCLFYKHLTRSDAVLLWWLVLLKGVCFCHWAKRLLTASCGAYAGTASKYVIACMYREVPQHLAPIGVAGHHCHGVLLTCCKHTISIAKHSTGHSVLHHTALLQVTFLQKHTRCWHTALTEWVSTVPSLSYCTHA